ncbi:MAG: hypothetical protein V5A62_03540 [Haloarculaceae archaeon]
MRRREFVIGAAAAAFGGCSARRGDGTDATVPPDDRTPEGESDPGTPTPSSTPTPVAGDTGTGSPTDAGAAARDHLAAAFDELRAMRPAGPEHIRVSEVRFRESDHELVRERVAAAEAALEDAAAAGGTEPESLPALRAAVDLARTGRELYDAVRVGIRAEWAFERHCYGARWAEARDSARRARRAVEAWERHGRAVVEAVEAVEAADRASVPRLSLQGWYRDGAVLGGVSGPWVDVLEGFDSFAEAVRLDEAGLAAMDVEEYRRAGERFSAATESVGEGHRRLAEAKADDAQGFQAYAVPIRRRCEPLRKAYATQVEAAEAAVAGETDRAERLESEAMERTVEAELEHPLPEPEGGAPENGSG